MDRPPPIPPSTAHAPAKRHVIKRRRRRNTKIWEGGDMKKVEGDADSVDNHHTQYQTRVSSGVSAGSSGARGGGLPPLPPVREFRIEFNFENRVRGL